MEPILNSAMCRCCASEGTFKDIHTKYHWMGDEEVYSVMLKECFDITLSSPQGDQSGICEVCITQLRNAFNFKKQVLHTEEQFQHMLGNKVQDIKLEYTKDSSEEPEDRPVSEADNSDPDFTPSIKEEEDEPESKPKAKKRAAKSTATRAKKPKLEAPETSTQRQLRSLATKCRSPVDGKLAPFTGRLTTVRRKTTDKGSKGSALDKRKTDSEKLKKVSIAIGTKIKSSRKKVIKLTSKDVESPTLDSTTPMKLKKTTEVDKHQENIRLILECSNATPIKSRLGIGYSCCFCKEQYPKAADLKRHNLDTHENAKSTFMKGEKLLSYIVKLDITNLNCTLCGRSIEDLDCLIDHLVVEHKSPIHTDLKNHIVPFKFEENTDTLKCVVCSNEFNNFKVLLIHMNVHYRNYICEICGGGFVNKRILLAHGYRHVTGVFNCQFCTKVFDNRIKQKDHERAVHKYFNKRNKCAYCGEKFTDYTKKNDHEVKVHGVRPIVLKCQACSKEFDNQRSLTVHVKRYHLMERWRAKGRALISAE